MYPSGQPYTQLIVVGSANVPYGQLLTHSYSPRYIPLPQYPSYAKRRRYETVAS